MNKEKRNERILELESQSPSKTGMRFGLSGCGGGLETVNVQSLVSLAKMAEDLGFSGIWMNEEHFQRPSDGKGRLCLSPIVLATSLAAMTERIRIGFSVLLLPLHQPLRLAEELATLDVLSGGRLDFGVSRGGNPEYSDAYGVDPAMGRETFEASLSFILRCWTEQEVLIGTRSYGVEPKPIQRPYPPIFIGTYNEDTARWAARVGHALIQHGIQSLPNVQRVLRAYADEGGVVAGSPVGRFVYVSETNTSAKRELEPVISDITNRLRRAGVPARFGTLPEAELEPGRFYEEMVIAGSPETCAEKIASLRDMLGISYLNCLSSFFGFLPAERLRASLHLFAEHVMPRFDESKEDGSECCCGLFGASNAERVQEANPKKGKCGK